jgi:hypothetical protein
MLKSAILCILCGAAAVSAGVLEVGPVGLNGSGYFFSPDYASWGGEGINGTTGVSFTASSSDGSVSISINDVEIGYPDIAPQVGPSFLDFNSPGLAGCDIGFQLDTFVCSATIDRIGGIASFSDIGTGVGLVQVYECCQGGSPGPLLAEAEVVTHLVFTSVITSPNRAGYFSASFDLVPEPGTLGIVLAGIIPCCFHLLRQRGVTR